MPDDKLAGKMLIEGVIHCITGMHIGGKQESVEMGGVDLLVIRDPVSRQPYIPGSSLKGKLRSLLERFYYAKDLSFEFNRNMRISGQDIRHHECGEESCAVCRLFGAAKFGSVTENLPASLYVRDAYLKDESKDELKRIETGFYLTEVKFENTLDRVTSAANPREIERVPRGAEFSFQMVYNLWEQKDRKDVEEDIMALFIAMRFLSDNYLGGHGSRGYGQVRLQDIRLKWRNLSYYEGQGDEVILAGKDIADVGSKVEDWLENLQ